VAPITPTPSRALAEPAAPARALLALHWAWSDVAYHALFFAGINPTAWLFAALFAVQAGASAWTGVALRRLTIDWGCSQRHPLAGILLLFALAYPGLALVTGHDWPRAHLWGAVPHDGVHRGPLLAAVRPVPRWLFVVPVL
jgi:Family of unknown function (DUF6064)